MLKLLKWNRDKIKGFGVGVFTALLFVSLIGTALASGQLKSINVAQGGIKLFVDGKLVKPTDADGNVVEPFIYEGTTYLPLRALSNALTNYQKPVQWYSATSSIYVGQAPVAEQTDIADLKLYNPSNGAAILTGRDAVFNVLDKQITPFNRLNNHCTLNGKGDYNCHYTYILNANYSQLAGQLIVPYTELGDRRQGGVDFYSVDKKGNETKISSFKTTAGDEPVQVSVDLRGVEILRMDTGFVQSDDFYGTVGNSGAFYNVTLAGIK